MIELILNNGVNELSNEAGLQVKGNHDPGLAGGLSPRELIEAAVALCTSLTLEHVLKRDEVEYDAAEVHVKVVASKEEGVKNRFTHFAVDLTLPKHFDAAYVKKLVKVVERGCTISNTITNGAQVTLQAK
jgi:uncharacterized OsmC-like protein